MSRSRADTDLRIRWDEKRTRRARRALVSGRGLAKAAFGTVDGRLDLRGLSAPGLWLWRVPVLRPARLRSLDLTAADLEGWVLRGADIDDCNFDRAECSGWLIKGGTIRRSSFAGADLRSTIMGDHTTWSEVDLERADIRGTNSSSARFEKVRFDQAKLVRREFATDILRSCSFAGLVNDCSFGTVGARPDALRQVDFSRAVLRATTFLGLDLKDVVPPVDPNHVVIHRPHCVLMELVRQLESGVVNPLSWQGDTLRMDLENSRHDQAFLAWHLADLAIDATVEGGVAAAAFLLELDHICQREAASGGAFLTEDLRP